MGTAIVIPDADFSGLGLPRVSAPVPTFNGALQGAWLFGSAWDGAGAAGADYSGNSRDAIIAGCDVGAGYVRPTPTAWPVLPVTPAQVMGSATALTALVVASVPSSGTVTTVPLIQSTEAGAIPNIQLFSLPASDTVRAISLSSAGQSQVDQAYIAADVEAQPAMYIGGWGAATLRAGVSQGDQLRIASGASSYPAAGTGQFRLGRVASGSMIDLHACLLYRGALTDDQIGDAFLRLRALLALKGVTL